MSIQVKRIQNNLIAAQKLKPILVTECTGGSTESTSDCDNNIEWQRTIFASPFTGIAGGAMNWKNQDFSRPELMEHLRYMKQFFDQIDFVNENWSSEATQGIGEVDNRAELLYLKNDIGTKALGLISNRTANFYTMGNEVDVDFMGNVIVHVDANDIWDDDLSICKRFVPQDAIGWVGIPNDFHVPIALVSTVDRDLRIKGMLPNLLYELNFYDPLNAASLPGNPFVEPIIQAAHANGELSIAFPFMDPLRTPFLLVEAKLLNTEFLTRLAEPTNHVDAGRQSLSIHFALDSITSKDEWKIYPNPADDAIWVTTSTGTENVSFSLLDNIGRNLGNWHFKALSNEPTLLKFPDISTGLYFLNAHVENGEKYSFKLVIK